MTQDDTRSPLDAYAPAQIALLIERGGVAKVGLAPVQTATLGVLAGAFIAFGAMFYTVTVTGSDLGFGPTQLLGGVAFSVGLILVLVGGAELFTGNSLIVMAWAERKVTGWQLLRNWGLVYLANFVGALGAVALFYLAGALDFSSGAVGQTAARIADAKLNLDFITAFFRGILCNALVCLAVWLSFAAHTVSGKILAIIFPVSAFVALGFEHSVANMYLIPIGMLANGSGIDLVALLRNLLPVTLGNIVGGGGLVALTYWLVYLRRPAAGGR
ncbi:MAG: formate/nitrite transporter family protein [Alphaproteobacteria bacterium]